MCREHWDLLERLTCLHIRGVELERKGGCDCIMAIDRHEVQCEHMPQGLRPWPDAHNGRQKRGLCDRDVRRADERYLGKLRSHRGQKHERPVRGTPADRTAIKTSFREIVIRVSIGCPHSTGFIGESSAMHCSEYGVSL